MAEGFAQIFPNSTGDKVRVVRNSIAGYLVDQQVVSIANERGALLPTDELLTAFGALRVAAPRTLFDSKFLYDKQAVFWAEALTGAGASAQANSMVTMTVAGNTDSVVRQTKMWFNYQSGKGQLVMLTGVFSQEANVAKRVGYFNGTDGIYLKVTGTGIAFEILKGGSVAETVLQAQWNADTLDGHGPSGFALDLTKVQILFLDFQWLGTGTVRVGFMINGRIVYAHEFHHANVLGASPYMNVPNLPVRYDLTASGGSGSLVQICATVISEGGSEDRGLVFAVDSGVTGLGLPSTGAVALVAIRLAAARLSAHVDVLHTDILLSSLGAARWALLLNPTIAGAAIAYAPVGNTSIEVGFGVAANLCTGGTELDAGYVSAQTRQIKEQIQSTLRLGSDLAGVPDVIALALTNVATTPTVMAVLGMREML